MNASTETVAMTAAERMALLETWQATPCQQERSLRDFFRQRTLVAEAQSCRHSHGLTGAVGNRRRYVGRRRRGRRQWTLPRRECRHEPALPAVLRPR